MTKDVKAAVNETTAEIQQRIKTTQEMMIGRNVRIVTEWRDQPFGSSKPSHYGKLFKVREAWYGEGRWSLFLGDFRCGIWLREVEFVD